MDSTDPSVTAGDDGEEGEADGFIAVATMMGGRGTLLGGGTEGRLEGRKAGTGGGRNGGWGVGEATDHTPASTTTPSSSVIKCPPTLTRHALGHTEKVEGGTPQEKNVAQQEKEEEEKK
ncbi:hypothetical protein Pcinc_001857 [Petrolisthes cinctipes]|uniref:Uncharacterized protein n=1 Tax=Petrolisthes cinctipes TaxID=88211 RepID=A0AAE1L454_PETCI|nr:hypothetical protein Pcinc_001857 [Petrolisthes cinctipes]